MRRLAAELEALLRGARVEDAGVLSDGRPAILLRSHGSTRLLCMDLFGTPPVVTVESGELVAEDRPGFSRSLARALRGATVHSVASRMYDRLITLSFRTRSRFGVEDELALSLELVPRFGNAVLIKGGTVVDALKKFAATTGARTTLPGRPYEPPPLPPAALPALVAEGDPEPGAMAFLESDAALHAPLFVYRSEGALQQAHLVPLHRFAGAAATREPSLLALLAEDRVQRLGGDAAARTRARRSALERRLTTRVRRTVAALDALRARERDIEARETLRRDGEAIYATLHEVAPEARAAAKERAAKLFARYRKLGVAGAHLEQRRRALALQRESLDSLLWELERAGEAELADIEVAFDALDRPAHRAAPKRRKRPPLEVRTVNGSRILIGRSPIENAELTFRIARPDDLWFHARGVPGAHVILARDDRRAPPEDDVALAAAIAAGHSKARESAKVAVDYAPRKRVRKQPDAAPGLVFYTGAKTITVVPRPG